MILALVLKNAPTGQWQLTDSRVAEPAPMFRGSDWAREPQMFCVRGITNVVEWYIECEVHGLIGTDRRCRSTNTRWRSGS